MFLHFSVLPLNRSKMMFSALVDFLPPGSLVHLTTFFPFLTTFHSSRFRVSHFFSLFEGWQVWSNKKTNCVIHWIKNLCHSHVFMHVTYIVTYIKIVVAAKHWNLHLSRPSFFPSSSPREVWGENRLHGCYILIKRATLLEGQPS